MFQVNNSTLNMENVRLGQNHAIFGGAIYGLNASSVQITNVAASQNKATWGTYPILILVLVQIVGCGIYLDIWSRLKSYLRNRSAASYSYDIEICSVDKP